MKKSPHYCNSVGIGALIVNHFRYLNYNITYWRIAKLWEI